MANDKIVHRPFRTINQKGGITTTYFENTSKDVIVDMVTGRRLDAELESQAERIATLEQTGGGGGSGGIPPHTHRLGDLVNVDIADALDNEVLTLEGESWVAKPIPAVPGNLSELKDVDFDVPPMDGDYLTFQNGAWVPDVLPESIIPDKLTDLADVSPNIVLKDGEILTVVNGKWDSAPLSIPLQLSDLTDVDISTAVIGDTIEFDGETWVAATPKAEAMQVGGYRSVKTVADRDALPSNEREEGMLCGVIDNNTVYQLIGGLDNAYWVLFTTGAGGATGAIELSYNPSGNLASTDVQSAIDELELKKMNIADTYSKTIIDDKFTTHTHSFNQLTDKPDLAMLHSHVNKALLDKFTENSGQLSWNGKTIGNMIADIYDTDRDGIIDSAKTLQGLTVGVSSLNHTAGLTGNIQAQLNSIASGTIYKGRYTNYAAMVAALPDAQQGYWVFIDVDENKDGSNTQYYHDGTDWIYGGGATQVPTATSTALGGIKLDGVLGNPASTAEVPLLTDTGVTPGTYRSATIKVEADGRISLAENGTAVFINDDNTSTSETWSSSKLIQQFAQKAKTDHTHSQLHDADMIGNVKVDMASIANRRVIAYDAINGKAHWIDSSGGRLFVGSKFISGDMKLIAGANTSLFIDEAAKTITINSTASGGGGGVPTLTEITHTEIVPAGETVFLSLDAAFNKYDIRTVEISNDVGVTSDIQIFDSATESKRRVYQSNKESYTYDIANVPCHDKDETKKLHAQIANYGSVSANISITINITNLN